MASRSAKQKAALKKAQLASARKRHRNRNRRPVSRSVRRRRRVATGIAIGAAGVYAAHKGRHAIRDSALKKRHGQDYISRKATYKHYTKSNAARKIVKNRTWKPTGKHAGHGAVDGVWLTQHRKRGHYDGLTRDVFGKSSVSIRLSRKQVLKNRTHAIPGGLDKSNPNILHVQIDKNFLNGRRVKHNLPRTARGVRRRYTGHRKSGLSLWESSRNSGVSVTRRKIKQTYKKSRGLRYTTNGKWVKA